MTKLRFILLSSVFFIVSHGFAFAQEQNAEPSVPPDTAVTAPVDPAATESLPQEGQVPVQPAEGENVAAPDASAPPVTQTTPEPAPALVPANLNPDNILNPITEIERALSEQLMYLNPQINVNKISSLFLSDWEHDLVTDARMGLTTSGPVPVAEVADDGIRDISLGGIVFRSSNDWTIWLNNARVTPTAIPAQVMDIKVYKEYIELEWFDRSKNLIYPIRLRAHQRFNLDTRMFLPGQG